MGAVLFEPLTICKSLTMGCTFVQKILMGFAPEFFFLRTCTPWLMIRTSSYSAYVFTTCDILTDPQTVADPQWVQLGGPFKSPYTTSGNIWLVACNLNIPILCSPEATADWVVIKSKVGGILLMLAVCDIEVVLKNSAEDPEKQISCTNHKSPPPHRGA